MSKVYGRRDRTARLLKLQILLSQNPDGLMVEGIAKKCSISKRTVYRDLEALETELGVPIWEKGSQRGLVEGYFLPPIHFTQREAISIFLALRLVERCFQIYNPDVASAFMKLNTVVSAPLQKYIQNTLEYMEQKSRNERITNNFNKLAEAWLSRHLVKIQYLGAFNKRVTERIIEPYFIAPSYYGRSSYIIAYCHEIERIMQFKINRIVGDAIICPETFDVPLDFSPDKYLDSAWGIHTREKLISVKLRFNQEIKEVITSNIWHSSQKVELQEDGSVIMSLTVHDAIDFRAWILGWGGLVEVLKPEIFKEEIINTAQSVICTNGIKKDLLMWQTGDYGGIY